MNNKKHPSNRAERLKIKFEKDQKKVREERASAVRRKLAREAAKAEETDNELRTVSLDW